MTGRNGLRFRNPTETAGGSEQLPSVAPDGGLSAAGLDIVDLGSRVPAKHRWAEDVTRGARGYYCVRCDRGDHLRHEPCDATKEPR